MTTLLQLQRQCRAEFERGKADALAGRAAEPGTNAFYRNGHAWGAIVRDDPEAEVRQHTHPYTFAGRSTHGRRPFRLHHRTRTHV